MTVLIVFDIRACAPPVANRLISFTSISYFVQPFATVRRVFKMFFILNLQGKNPLSDSGLQQGVCTSLSFSCQRSTQ